MRTGSEHNVLAAQADQLRDSKASLDRQCYKEPVAPTAPGSDIGCLQERFNLMAIKEFDLSAVKSLAGHGKHPLDQGCVVWALISSIFEEGVDGGQADVSTSSADAAFILQVIEECAYQGSIQVPDRQCRWSLLEMTLRESQEQAKGVTIARDGVGTGLSLSHKTVHEE
jgi:hypothetical protein